MSHIYRVVRRLHASGLALQAEVVSSVGASPKREELEQYKKYYQSLRNAVQKPEEYGLELSAPLMTLYKRLDMPKEFSLSTLARCLTCRSSKLPEDVAGTLRFATTTEQKQHFHDNHGLNIFGKNILTFYVTEQLMKRYPRLPTPVLNAAVDAYIGENVLANVGKGWGIEVENSTVMDRYLRGEPLYLTLGRLRFFNNTLREADGVQVVLSENKSPDAAMALAVRSIIGGLWASTQEQQRVFKFIDDHILSRKLDVSRLFQFEQPTRELATLCRREGLSRPVSKLIAESGRLSKAPVFIVGVFSGEEKLGEGFGSSLKEAKARAATDALMKWYCYEPATLEQAPVIDAGQVLV